MHAKLCGDYLLKSDWTDSFAGTGAPEISAQATKNDDGTLSLIFINRTDKHREIELDLTGVLREKTKARLYYLTSKYLTDVNDFASPDRISPKDELCEIEPSGKFVIKPYSFSILKTEN